MPFIEAPTTFYLGRRYDQANHRMGDEVVYYDSRDLTTHAVVVGMTGSGKTGLCINILEEAVLDNIPAICIDPKGDITNLLLTFPNLNPEDFAPWINEDDARRSGQSNADYARDVAQQWRDGLTSWDIVAPRIGAMKRAAKFSIYTPGSDAGLPVSILNSLKAPRDWVGQEEAHREQISGLVTALLALVGKQVDPVKDREHVLISNIFEYAWANGHDLTLEDIILQVQKPPFSKLGVFDVNTFFPEKDRFKLAMDLNNIVAAPSFKSWIEGEPLDIQNLLYTPEGKPRVSIFYIAHLSEVERSFIITLILENMLSWMRGLSGTTSLRCLLYFDELFGHFPPAPKNPPTKDPILRLLKQGRAFGIGMLLASQNPGDLDYKGLSNAGTWIIGKLQTEFDKRRVMSGLQSATTAQSTIDVDKIGDVIGSLDPRVFLVHNVHNESGPLLMHTRWSMSYLRGPLTRQQVRILMDAQRQALGLTSGPQAVQTTPPTAAALAAAIPYGLPYSTPPGTPVAITPAAAPVVPLIPVPPIPTPPVTPSAQQISDANAPYIPGKSPLPKLPMTVPGATPVVDLSAAPSTVPPPDLPGVNKTPTVAGPESLPVETPADKAKLPKLHVSSSGAIKPVTPTAAPIDLPAPDPLPGGMGSSDAMPIDTDVPFYVNPAPTDILVTSPTPVPVTTNPTSSTKDSQSTQKMPEGFHEKPYVLPPSTAQFFLPTALTSQQAVREWEKKFGYGATVIGDAKLLYKPVLLAQLVVRYLDRKIGVEEDQRWAFQVPNLEKAGIVRWSDYQATTVDPGQVSDSPFDESAYYGTMSPGLTDPKRMNALKQEIIDYVYRTATLNLYHNATLDLYAKTHENRRDFLLRAQQKAREGRDAEIDKVTQRYDDEIGKLEEKRRKELREVTYDKQALEELKREELYTTGEAVLGLMRGRTAYTLSRMSRSRRYKRQAQERAIMGQQSVADIEHDIAVKQEELQRALNDVNDKWAKIAAAVEEVKLPSFKKDITLEIFGLGWVPAWYMTVNGQQLILPAYAIELKGASSAPTQGG